MKTFDAGVFVLMYHRVDLQTTDPWSICATPEHFEQQISVLKNLLPVITVEEAVKQFANNSIQENSACITFDDGYADNIIHALPVLSQYQCPATFFIATAFIGSSIPFWWDELEMICLHAKQLPSVLQLTINKKACRFSFETELTEQMWQQHIAWKWHEKPPTKRCKTFLEIWHLFLPLSISLIEKNMEDMRIWANLYFHSRLPLNEDQLKQLSGSELATIGLHTHTHLDLSSHSADKQEDDIVKGKSMLAEQLNIQSNLLAYPYGRYNAGTVSTVEKLNIDACFTTEEMPVTNSSHKAKLGRYQVGNWNQQQFEEQLKGWMYSQNAHNK